MKFITPLTKEIINLEVTINIGTIGHVAHDKTTLVGAISGVQTIRHKIEKERNITYVLGYTNAKLYKCPKCPEPESYKSAYFICWLPWIWFSYGKHVKWCCYYEYCFIINTSKWSMSQTTNKWAFSRCRKYGFRKKIDLIKEENEIEHYNQIKRFVQGTKAAKSPIIPISPLNNHTKLLNLIIFLNNYF